MTDAAMRAKEFRVKKRRPCVWCGRKPPKMFRAPGPPTCDQPDCEKAQQEVRRELNCVGVLLTHVEAAAVQRLVRVALDLPPPLGTEVPTAEWFEGLESA